jgi:hypothetical protein
MPTPARTTQWWRLLHKAGLFSHLPLEGCPVGPVLRHGFHPPEAQQEGSIQIAQTVHPQGRTPESGNFCMLFHRLYTVPAVRHR